MSNLIPVYISKSAASLDLANLPEGETYEIKRYNTNRVAYAVAKRLREQKNSDKLINSLHNIHPNP